MSDTFQQAVAQPQAPMQPLPPQMPPQMMVLPGSMQTFAPQPQGMAQGLPPQQQVLPGQGFMQPPMVALTPGMQQLPLQFGANQASALQAQQAQQVQQLQQLATQQAVAQQMGPSAFAAVQGVQGVPTVTLMPGQLPGAPTLGSQQMLGLVGQAGAGGSPGLAPYPMAAMGTVPQDPRLVSPSAVANTSPTRGQVAGGERQSHFAHHYRSGNCNVYVGGLPDGFFDKHLREMCAQCGPVVSARVMLHIHTGMSRGHGFVRFETADSAAAAISAFHGRPAPLTGGAVGAQRMTVRYADPKGSADTVADPPSNRVFVRNIPLDATGADVRRLFAQHGAVQQCALHLDSAAFKSGGNGVRSRIAYVTFATIAEAQAATDALHGSRPFPASVAALMVKAAESEAKRALRRGSDHGDAHEGRSSTSGESA